MATRGSQRKADSREQRRLARAEIAEAEAAKAAEAAVAAVKKAEKEVERAEKEAQNTAEAANEETDAERNASAYEAGALPRFEDIGSEEDEPELDMGEWDTIQPAAAAGTGKGKGKGKAVVQPGMFGYDDFMESEEEEEAYDWERAAAARKAATLAEKKAVTVVEKAEKNAQAARARLAEAKEAARAAAEKETAARAAAEEAALAAAEAAEQAADGDDTPRIAFSTKTKSGMLEIRKKIDLQVSFDEDSRMFHEINKVWKHQNEFDLDFRAHTERDLIQFIIYNMRTYHEIVVEVQVHANNKESFKKDFPALGCMAAAFTTVHVAPTKAKAKPKSDTEADGEKKKSGGPPKVPVSKGSFAETRFNFQVNENTLEAGVVHSIVVKVSTRDENCKEIMAFEEEEDFELAGKNTAGNIVTKDSGKSPASKRPKPDSGKETFVSLDFSDEET